MTLKVEFAVIDGVWCRYKTEFSMWAISASPLVVTTPIYNCTTPALPTPSCSVVMLEQHSKDSCTLGESFDCYANNTMWTEGCRGVFYCNGRNVTCDVDGDGRHVCGCAAPVCTPTITALQKEILLNTEVIAINQDVTPQGRPVTEGDLTVWTRALSDGSVAVALYNQEDTAQSIGFNTTQLGWEATAEATVRDLWTHTLNGTITGMFSPVMVEPHATVVLRVYRKTV